MTKRQVNDYLNMNIYELSSDEIKQIRFDLEGFLLNCNIEYYKLNNSLITDALYDSLSRYLRLLMSLYFSQDNSIILNSIGADIRDSLFTKVQHNTPMLSLDNVFTQEELSNFIQKIKRFLSLNAEDNIPFLAELKIDGLSLSIIYEDSVLKYALTRGDGSQGEDVTAILCILPIFLNI